MSYINNIPSSLVGYGTTRQQFQSYDGILDVNLTRTRSSRIADLQDRIRFLQSKLSSVESIMISSGLNGSGNLSCSTMNINTLSSTNTTTVSQTSKTIHVTTGDIALNDRSILLRPEKQYSGGATYQQKQEIGYDNSVDGVRITPWKIGSLSYKYNLTDPLTCLQWSKERIRSHKTFQAGTKSGYSIIYQGSTPGVVTFPVRFNDIPVVVAKNVHSSAGDASRYYYIGLTKYTSTKFVQYVRIDNITTSGFNYSVWEDLGIKDNSNNYIAPYQISNSYLDLAWIAVVPTAAVF